MVGTDICDGIDARADKEREERQNERRISEMGRNVARKRSMGKDERMVEEKKVPRGDVQRGYQTFDRDFKGTKYAREGWDQDHEAHFEEEGDETRPTRIDRQKLGRTSTTRRRIVVEYQALPFDTLVLRIGSALFHPSKPLRGCLLGPSTAHTCTMRTRFVSEMSAPPFLSAEVPGFQEIAPLSWR